MKKNWSSPAPVSTAYVPCSSVTKSATEPFGVGAHHHAQVGEPADEQRVAGAEHVVGRRGKLGERDHERGRVLAPVRARRVGVEEVQDDRDLGARPARPRCSPGRAWPSAGRRRTSESGRRSARRSRRRFGARPRGRRRVRFRTAWPSWAFHVEAGHGAEAYLGCPHLLGVPDSRSIRRSQRTRPRTGRPRSRSQPLIPVSETPHACRASSASAAWPLPTARQRVSTLPCRWSPSPSSMRSSGPPDERAPVDRRPGGARPVGDAEEHVVVDEGDGPRVRGRGARRRRPTTWRRRRRSRTARRPRPPWRRWAGWGARAPRARRGRPGAWVPTTRRDRWTAGCRPRARWRGAPARRTLRPSTGR